MRPRLPHPSHAFGRCLAGAVALALLLVLGMPSVAQLSSAGPNSASSSGDCVNDAAIGTIAWTNPGQVLASDDLYATATVDGETTNYLKCTNFGFAIPAASSIDGIVVNA